MKKISLLFLLLFLSCSFCKAQLEGKKTDNINYLSYCNARYGYCVEYPKDILYPQPESDNGDGKGFKNKQNEKILSVWGCMTMGNSIEQQFYDDLRGNENRTITYQKLGKTFFVISGYEEGKIFYQKTILKGNTFAYALLKYNESEKSTYNQISERVSKSFK